MESAEPVTAALAIVDAREQLTASRARIVESSDAARRRIERDLHDGAQQHLVSLALSLRMLQSRLDDPELAGELESARRELDQALAELRELAHGIHPSVLTDRGLGPALMTLANRSRVPVELETVNCAGLPAAVETAAYFVVAESLTNVAKHARSGHAEVRVRVEGRWATIEVQDDGVGGADASGSGLRGLSDRVSAIGGALEVESPPGEGTVVRARIPLAAPEASPVELPAPRAPTEQSNDPVRR
jgi:signal transduction histidine kinase